MSLSSDYLNVEECSSGSCSPVFSWSPLPPRRQLNFVKNDDEFKKDDELDVDLYPNCDVSIWLRSCEKEIVTPINGEVKGTIPEWLSGSLIRNGPGSLKVGDEQFTHLFDSSALLHRIAAVFSNETSDNAMISVYPFGDQLYAFNEIPIIHQINIDTLGTEGKVKIDDYVSVVHHTSHPHVLNDGTVFNLGLSIYATGPCHTIVQFPKNEDGDSQKMFEKAKIVASIPARWPLNPSYMHSFGITENFYIIVEQPLSISVPGIIKSKFNNEPLAGCFRWYHEEYTRISVVSRSNGKLHKHFFADSFFYLHVINQYELDNHVIIDICIYKDPYMLDCMYIETMKTMHQNPDYAKMFRGRPVRFVLPLSPDLTKTKKNLVQIKDTKARAHYLPNGDILVIPEKLCSLGCETPRINYDTYLGKSYRFFYAISSDVDAENPGTLIKVDTKTKSTMTWGEKNCYPSEPIFIPRPNSMEEDDGIILSAMVWGRDDPNHVGLLILDGQTLVELGRADFKTPSPVPKCLHGWFCHSDQK